MLTKIQYKNFEPGEFTGIKARTAPETIQLIENFPWAEQRDQNPIDLTNPSITIEGPNNDFLKLEPYYNNKFVLHYVDRTGHLYTRSFEQLPDTIPVINAFFEQPNFDTKGFRKELTLFKKIAPHFVTNNFIYTLDRRRLTAVIAIFLLGSFVLAIFTLATLRAPILFIFPLILTILIIGGIALLINHVSRTKDKILIVSKGSDEFSFGPVDNPRTFYKKDIMEIVTYGNQQKDRSFGILAKVEINFVNGTSLEISCLMLGQNKLVAKFPQTPQSIEHKYFPFIHRVSSALSG